MVMATVGKHDVSHV